MSDVKWLNRLDPKQKFSIIQYDREDKTPISRVSAALPENFGMSVGSVFTDPFNANVTTNPIAEKVSAYINISRKLGSRVTSVYYSGPEPTEISLELEFVAFYSAQIEVVNPIVSLMLMAVGREYDYQDLRGQFTGRLAEFVNEFIESIEDSKAGSLAGEIKAIIGPNPCRVNFGNVMKIPSAYVSTAAPSFSNVLDNQFMPMSATCALTIKIERNPVYSNILDIFGRGG